MGDPLPGRPLEPRDPAALGPWVTRRRIGAGGMGVVFLAENGQTQAAVKMVRPGLLDDPHVQTRFSREVDTLRRVRDVHICGYLDADVDHDPAWMATEYVPGPTLRDQVTDAGPISGEAWWQLAQGLAQALAVLEVHGVIHRDFKPANVILADRGPVLIDFGIAHPEEATSLTLTGMVAGSPSWLSPEQADGHPVTTASDVFSLGSVLAYAATGRPPFGSGQTVAVLYAIVTAEPDLLGIDKERADLLQTLLAKRPADRPNPRELLQQLRRRKSPSPGQPVAGQPDPDATIAGYVVSTTAAAPVVDAADGDTVVSGPGQAPPPDAARPPSGVAAVPPGIDPEPAPQRRSSTWLWIVVIIAALGVAGWLLFTGAGDGGEEQPEPSPTPSASATPEVPPAPAESMLRSGDLLLRQWFVDNNAGLLGVRGTMVNEGTEPYSGRTVVFVYRDGVYSGSASAEVSSLQPGESRPVTFTGSDEWEPGDPILVLEAE